MEGIKLTQIDKGSEEKKDPRPAQEALRWMILLQEDLSDKNIQSAFDVWLSEDPANRKAWLKISLTTDIMQKTVENSPDLKTSLESVENSRLVTPSKMGKRSKSMRNLVALIGVFILGGMLLTYLPPAIQFARADHSTGIGESRRLTLADGSHVYLGGQVCD